MCWATLQSARWSWLGSLLLLAQLFVKRQKQGDGDVSWREAGQFSINYIRREVWGWLLLSTMQKKREIFPSLFIFKFPLAGSSLNLPLCSLVWQLGVFLNDGWRRKGWCFWFLIWLAFTARTFYIWWSIPCIFGIPVHLWFYVRNHVYFCVFWQFAWRSPGAGRCQRRPVGLRLC